MPQALRLQQQRPADRPWPVPAGDGPRVRTLLADDHDLFRSRLQRSFERHPRVDVVAVCANGTEALERIRLTRPRIALVDLRMPALDGLQIAAHVAGDPSLSGVHVVLLSARCDDELVEAARRAGAADCLDKASSRTELCAAVLRVADHGRAGPPGESPGPAA